MPITDDDDIILHRRQDGVDFMDYSAPTPSAQAALAILQANETTEAAAFITALASALAS